MNDVQKAFLQFIGEELIISITTWKGQVERKGDGFESLSEYIRILASIANKASWLEEHPGSRFGRHPPATDDSWYEWITPDVDFPLCESQWLSVKLTNVRKAFDTIKADNKPA